VKTSRARAQRYEKAAPGELIHMDVKKLGRIPDGGGWRVHGMQQGKKNRGGIGHGYEFIHSAIDDHSRVAYSEILDDERKETVVAFWARAIAWFADAGIQVQAVMTDIQAGWAAFEQVRRPAGRIGVVRHPP